MAVNGARVSSLNRTARSAIDTANLKIGGCQTFPNVHSLFEYNYRLTAMPRDRRESRIRAVGKNEKLESFKLESLKLESFAEVGKTQTKLDSFAAVGRFWLKLECLNELGKL